MVIEFICVTLGVTVLVLWFSYMSSGNSRSVAPIRSNKK